MELNRFIDFTLGKNPSRLKERATKIYTPDDLEDDLFCINEHDDSPKCIINLIKPKAAPISIANKDKQLTSNFLLCEFDGEVLDKWFFCYQFNEGKELGQQISMYNQGITTSVKKLNVKTIGELKIELPGIKKQRIIGMLYRQTIIQDRLMIKQAEYIKRLSFGIIDQIIKEGK